MKKFMLILLLMLIPMVNAYTYYENATINISVSDGINKTIYYLNYTTTDYSYGSLWRIKHGHYGNTSTCNGARAEYNITIPIDCWVYNNDTLQLRVLSNYSHTEPSSQPECFNGTRWREIGDLHNGSYNGDSGTPRSYPIRAFDEDWNLGDTYNNGVYDSVSCGSTFGNDASFIEDGLHASSGINLSVRDILTNQLIYPTCYDSDNVLVLSNYSLFNESSSMSCTLNGYNPISTSVNISFGEQFYFNMTSHVFNISFYDWNDSLLGVNGFLTDENGTNNYTNINNLSIAKLNITEDSVNVQFGRESINNYTNIYEFENDYNVTLDINITILDNYPITSFIKVEDTSGQPINDVRIIARASRINHGDEFKLIGQRYTGRSGLQGTTFFYLEENLEVELQFIKDGYTAENENFESSAYDFTSSDPLTIVLRRSENVAKDNVFFWTPLRFGNRTYQIPIGVFAPDRSNIQYITNYRDSQGYGNRTIDLDTYSLGFVNLSSGTDYNPSGTGDITITFYVDGLEWGSKTIEYIGQDETKFIEPTGISQKWLKRFSFFGMIFVVGILGFLFKGGEDEMGSGSIGLNAFMIGSLVLSIVVDGMFYLGFTCGLYYVMIYLRRYYSE